MKAIIKIDVPEWQIGKEVSIYFPDTMSIRAKCEAVKERERPEKLLPCICGSKRREHWYGITPYREILKCPKCNRKAEGKNEIESHKAWNEMIREELKK